MPKKRFKAERTVLLLRQTEVLMSPGKAAPLACREDNSQQSYYRRRKEYGVRLAAWFANMGCDRF
jgi:hypothetical protein